MSTTEAVQASPEVVPIKDMNQFVQVLVAWHSERCVAVQQLLTVPEDSEFQVGEQPPVVLTPEVLAGFKLGVEMAMMQLGTLPFVAETEDAPVPPADAAG